MKTKTTQPFVDTICGDVRKIIDEIFKDCRPEDLDRLHLTSCNYVSDCEKLNFHDYWNYSGQTKGCELRFNVWNRTDYEIIVTGIQCEDERMKVTYSIDVSGDLRPREIAVSNLHSALECGEQFATGIRNACDTAVASGREQMSVTTLLEKAQPAVKDMACPIVMGIDMLDNTPVAFDLFQFWNLLVAGEYDSRMNIIHTAITSIRKLSMSDMHLLLVESRNGAFDMYRGIENIEILDSPEMIAEKLTAIAKLHKKGKTDVLMNEWKNTVLIFDDWANTSIQDKKQRNEIAKALPIILQHGYLHVVLSSKNAVDAPKNTVCSTVFTSLCLCKSAPTYDLYLNRLTPDLDKDNECIFSLTKGADMIDANSRFSRIHCATC